jgi:hypothetical protein
MNPRARSPHGRNVAILVLVFILSIHASAGAAPTVGFHEEWPTSVDGWGGGTATSNPGTGGIDGAGDGYLLVSSAFRTRFGTFSLGPEYFGDWVAAGITQVRVLLNDVNNADVFEIHFSIGHASINFWQYNIGLIPPHNQWGEYVVNLASSANWTQIQGTDGDFTGALQNVDRVHLRHDSAPFLMAPDSTMGDLGIDHLQLLSGVIAVGPDPVGITRPVELSPPAPNPSRGPVTLSLTAHDARPVRVQIVDVAGRSIRDQVLPASGGAPRLWVWDGLDASGHRVAPGSYRVRAFSASGGMSRTLVRVE